MFSDQRRIGNAFSIQVMAAQLAVSRLVAPAECTGIVQGRRVMRNAK
jgi:hypothetical protein